MTSFAQNIIARLWWGPLRRLFEALLRRTVPGHLKILFDPLRGSYFIGGLSQMLGIYEIEVQATVVEHLTAGDVFYDIGANKGYMTLLGAACVGLEGAVYAFEPFPANVERLQQALADNKVTTCTLVPKAVSGRSGTVTLFHGAGDATPSLIPDEGLQIIQVVVVSLDEFACAHRWPSLIKIDVEGAEVRVLEGAEKMLRSPEAPVWIVETHSKEIDEAVSQIFKSSGYSMRSLASRRRKNRIYPRHLIAWKARQG